MLAVGNFAFNMVSARLFPDAWGELARTLTAGRRMLLVNAAIRMAVGYVIVWLYAAARFRLRSTMRTAARVGLAAWFLMYIPALSALYLGELVGAAPIAFLGVWGLGETMVAALAGGFVHQQRKPPGRY